jgi:hypothetical protein
MLSFVVDNFIRAFILKQRSPLHGSPERTALHFILDNGSTKKALMEPSVQELFHDNVTEHLNKPNWFNKNWLAIHGPLAKASIKRVREKAIGGVKAIPYHTGILTETGTKINFRFRYRRKWTLTRQKSPTDLKKILVGRLECRFPDGNEIHSRRLHQSNGNLFEHVKFYILPTFYTLIGWTLMKMRLNFNW